MLFYSWTEVKSVHDWDVTESEIVFDVLHSEGDAGDGDMSDRDYKQTTLV
jgi:hypothetical protein